MKPRWWGHYYARDLLSNQPTGACGVSRRDDSVENHEFGSNNEQTRIHPEQYFERLVLRTRRRRDLPGAVYDEFVGRREISVPFSGVPILLIALLRRIWKWPHWLFYSLLRASFCVRGASYDPRLKPEVKIPPLFLERVAEAISRSFIYPNKL